MGICNGFCAKTSNEYHHTPWRKKWETGLGVQITTANLIGNSGLGQHFALVQDQPSVYPEGDVNDDYLKWTWTLLISQVKLCGALYSRRVSH
jgi:hypothetical protein